MSNNIITPLFYFVTVFFSRVPLNMHCLEGQKGRVWSGIGLARLVRGRDPASSCSQGWVVQVAHFFVDEVECVDVR